jgi:hypothetical protein
LPVLIWLAVLVRRLGVSGASTMEMAIVVALSFMLSAPAQAIIDTPQQRWYVVQQAVTRPVAKIAAMKEFVRWVHVSFASSAAERAQRRCASMGIAALIPDELAPEEVIGPGSNLSVCRTLLLLHADMHYRALSAQAEASGFKRVATRENAELWMIDTH